MCRPCRGLGRGGSLHSHGCHRGLTCFAPPGKVWNPNLTRDTIREAGHIMNNDEEQRLRRRGKRLWTSLRRVLLVVVFLYCFYVYGLTFYLLTSLTERAAGIKLHWLWPSLMMGIGLMFAWAVSRGLHNLFKRRPFLEEMHWREVLVVVFCFSLYVFLLGVIDQLAPPNTRTRS